MTALLPYDAKVEARKTAERQRFPIHPLERLIPHDPDHTGRTLEVADALGITVNRLRYYRRLGLTEAQADEFACHLGLLPMLIEGWSWWEHAC